MGVNQISRVISPSLKCLYRHRCIELLETDVNSEYKCLECLIDIRHNNVRPFTLHEQKDYFKEILPIWNLEWCHFYFRLLWRFKTPIFLLYIWSFEMSFIYRGFSLPCTYKRSHPFVNAGVVTVKAFSTFKYASGNQCWFFSFGLPFLNDVYNEGYEYTSISHFHFHIRNHMSFAALQV